MKRRFPGAWSGFVQRLRVPAGFLLLAAFAWLSSPNAWSLALGLPVAALGLTLRAWAAGHLAKDQALATTGPYAHSRNPLYLGTLAAAAGIAVASRSVPLAALFAAIFALVYLPVLEQEAEHLQRLFSEYADYAERVPLLAPRWSGYVGGGRFRWSLYLRNQEYKALAAFLAATALLAWKAWR